jgi:hypothetical protein
MKTAPFNAYEKKLVQVYIKMQLILMNEEQPTTNKLTD